MQDSSRPQNVNAERTVLGAMMHDESGETADAVIGRIRAEDFYRLDHQALYRLIVQLRDGGKPTSTLAVLEAAGRNASTIGGASYVCELPYHVVSTANVLHYVGIIVDAARSRDLFDTAVQITQGVLDRRDPGELADEMSQRADAVRRARGGPGQPSLIADAIAATETARALAPRTSVPTGFPELDDMCGGGLKAGQLVVIGARTSWGKSALALSMLLHAAHAGESVGLVSLEMSEDQLADRVVARLADVPVHVVEKGGFDAHDRDRIDRGIELADGLPLWTWCPPQVQTVASIASQLRAWRREGVSIACIDYLGRIAHQRDRTRTEAQLVGQTTKELKTLANELGIPIVLCAQMNRKTVEAIPRQRKDVDWWHNVPMPQLNHLKESGDIEQDADKVIFPVPADVIRTQQIVPNLDAPVGAAVLVMAKNRQGPTGIAQARWHGATASYRRPAAPLRMVSGAPQRHFSEGADDE